MLLQFLFQESILFLKKQGYKFTQKVQENTEYRDGIIEDFIYIPYTVRKKTKEWVNAVRNSKESFSDRKDNKLPYCWCFKTFFFNYWVGFLFSNVL